MLPYTEYEVNTFLFSFLLHLQEIMVGSQYQAEIPPYLGRYSNDEKGKFF